MGDDDKAALDHLARLADDRWREYDHKSQAEWKLCYALWAALLATASVLLSNLASIKLSAWGLVIAVAIFGLLMFALHAGMNVWLHERLGDLRDQLNAIFRRRAELLQLPFDPPEPKSWDTLGFQALVTLLLVALLIAVAASKFAVGSGDCALMV